MFIFYTLFIYLCRMGKNDWKSQQVLATELGVTVQVVNNWVRRGNKNIKTKKDENTGLTLVKWVGEKKS